MTIWLAKVVTNQNEWQMPLELPRGVQFLVWQHEQSPTTNVIHIQAFIHMEKPTKLPGIMKTLGLDPKHRGVWHVEQARGSDQDNLKYCSKTETRMADTEPTILGKPSKGQGTRTDLASACALIKEGGIKLVMDEMPEVYVKYPRGMKDLDDHHHSKFRSRHEAPIIVVLWGKTNTGKTKRAHEWLEAVGEPFYIKDSDHKWWDGYRGEKYALIDELGSNITIFELLKIFDRYALSREVKGGHCRLACNRFVVTSNLHPADWFLQAHPEHKESLLRRLTHVRQVTSLDEFIPNPFLPPNEPVEVEVVIDV